MVQLDFENLGIVLFTILKGEIILVACSLLWTPSLYYFTVPIEQIRCILCISCDS